MRRFIFAAFLLTIVAAGCQNQRIEALEDRVARLENDVTELKQRPAASQQPTPEMRAEGLQKLKDTLQQWMEKSYVEDSSLAAGTGGIEVLVIDREASGGDAGESGAGTYLKALQNLRDPALKSISGVKIFIGSKEYGKTDGKQPFKITGLSPADYELRLVSTDGRERTYPVEVREKTLKQVVTFFLSPDEEKQRKELFDKLLEQRTDGASGESTESK